MCATPYEDQPLKVAGNPTPVITAEYNWEGVTISGAKYYDYWKHADLGYYVWFSDTNKFYQAANTYPADPGGGDSWWQTDKDDAVGVYYPQGTAAGLIDTHATEEEKTSWHQWGHDRNWLVRSGAEKEMHGQAFWPRNIWPPWYINADYAIHPRPSYEVEEPDEQVCWFRASDQAIFYREYFTDIAPYPGTSSISIFQVNPANAEASFERKRTRIMGSAEKWPYQNGWNLLNFYTQWKPDNGIQVRYFTRAWNHLGFRHVGPKYTTFYPPP